MARYAATNQFVGTRNYRGCIVDTSNGRVAWVCDHVHEFVGGANHCADVLLRRWNKRVTESRCLAGAWIKSEQNEQGSVAQREG